ncbi:Phospho-2-dehydro-3-deoxyheptonate aldolase, Tyr-sensitive [Chlamydiales bacterium STE3]|nr:Phospho-2-dehydro-3-deoxyheptonate aldolase, Tyr-sensitive [Chlamydiales bacterium STE3]
MIETPTELIQQFPLEEKNKIFLKKTRETISKILNGEDQRLLVIVGPCSIHDIKGALDYAQRLKKLQETCSSSLFFVMRTYFEKARTSTGWKGMLYDPYLNGTNQIAQGLRIIRRFLTNLATLQIPSACEFIDPSLDSYIGDLISWGCIGARTASSQIHRQIASNLDMPVGFKNTPEGSIEPAIHGIIVASKPHSYIGIDREGKVSIKHSKGNPDCHLVLRGSEQGPNYQPDSVAAVTSFLKDARLKEQILIDCSHDNSGKKHEVQETVFKSIIDQLLKGNAAIRGVMLESYLHPGSQRLKQDLAYGYSITDPCLGWNTTEALLHWAHQQLLQEACQEQIATLKCATV